MVRQTIYAKKETSRENTYYVDPQMINEGWKEI